MNGFGSVPEHAGGNKSVQPSINRFLFRSSTVRMPIRVFPIAALPVYTNRI